MESKYGVLLAVSSLWSRHGIGDFGKSAYKFVDWLKKHNYKYWQVLPLNPVGPGNSPYMSTCSEALEPRYIDLDALVKEGLLNKVPDFHKNSVSVDYAAVEKFKEKYLWKAFRKYKKNNNLKAFNAFKKQNVDWVIPYSIFISLRRKNGLYCWNTWIFDEDKVYDFSKGYPQGHEEECEFYIWCQMVAYKQWFKLWKYAKKQGLLVIADCPFYVGIDSTDCWTNKDQFLFDEKFNPTLVSGVPPDCFSEDGQLWGTPIFDFKKMKENNYKLLVNRIGKLATTCDLLRLDHFRAWDTYCVIPGTDENARRGEWWVGPRTEFFDELYRQYPNIQLIAEDLGDLFQGVHDLRDHYNLPGMYITEFTVFDINQTSKVTQIVYPGTHDNQSLVGWYKTLPQENINFLKNRFAGAKDLIQAMFDYTWNLPSLMTIVPLQDLLGLDDRARMNYPGTVGSPNWEWKLKDASWMKRIIRGNK